MSTVRAERDVFFDTSHFVGDPCLQILHVPFQPFLKWLILILYSWMAFYGHPNRSKTQLGNLNELQRSQLSSGYELENQRLEMPS